MAPRNGPGLYFARNVGDPKPRRKQNWTSAAPGSPALLKNFGKALVVRLPPSQADDISACPASIVHSAGGLPR